MNLLWHGWLPSILWSALIENTQLHKALVEISMTIHQRCFNHLLCRRFDSNIRLQRGLPAIDMTNYSSFVSPGKAIKAACTRYESILTPDTMHTGGHGSRSGHRIAGMFSGM